MTKSPPSRAEMVELYKALTAKKKAQEKELAESSLYEFVKLMWHVVEPANPLIEGWVMEAICLHLEAVTHGVTQRLIINVPPGSSKSLISCVFWPAWEWGPCGMRSYRYAAFSYTSTLTERDNGRFMQLLNSPLYREYWGADLEIGGGNIKVKNNATGWKLATSISGVGTGERADRLILDDLNNVKEAESKAILESTNTWIREVMPTRLNHLSRSAIVAIQQRTSEEDCTGTLVANRDDWTWLMIPMRYDPDRHCTTEIGWTDPRTEPGELCWPERFPEDELSKLEREMGPYAVAGQLQQAPSPRGGGIIRTEWWRDWTAPQFPALDYVVAALDTGMTEKDNSDPSAMIVLGSWQDSGTMYVDDMGVGTFVANNVDRNDREEARYAVPLTETSVPRLMMVYGWTERYTLPDLMERVILTCVKYKVSTLVIENKTHGHAVNQELRKRFSQMPFNIVMYDPRQYGDKTARLYSVQHLFSEGLVWAPTQKAWADDVIQQVGAFPRAKHDEYVDCLSMGLGVMRRQGFVKPQRESVSEIMRGMTARGKKGALYDA